MRCKKGLWDSTVPGINFDNNGVSNYAKIFESMISTYPRGNNGMLAWEKIVDKAKLAGKNRNYDCLVGVSGGTDSSYLLHLLVKKYGLRPLAITLDNGWNSDISVKNIKSITNKLKIDLETYVINYEEIKDILKSFMKAGIPWIDGPTDHAIKAILHKTAKKEGIKFVFHGSDFRTEGNQPNEWTHTDSKMIKNIQKKFGSLKIKSFPLISLTQEIISSFLRGVKLYRPYYFIDYNKKEAQQFLEKEYGWIYYGGHHHENLFTKFAIADWLPNKFNIDKRIITLSALVLSKEICRDEALEELSNPPYNKTKMIADREFIFKKLELSQEDFDKIWNAENKSIFDYPSNYNLIKNLSGLINTFYKYILPYKPLSLIQDKHRESNE